MFEKEFLKSFANLSKLCLKADMSILTPCEQIFSLIKLSILLKESSKVALKVSSTSFISPFNSFLILEETEFNIIKSSNTIEIEKLNVRLSELDSEMTSLKTDKSKQIDKVKLFEKYRNLSDLNKIVLDAFINKIEIGKIDPLTSERPINIDWNLYSA